MGLFSRKKPKEKALSAADDRGWTRIFDWHPGAWQQDAAYNSDQSVLAFYAVFACTTLISDDIGKLRPKLERKSKGIWKELPSLDVLTKPNTYQNHIQFKQWWLLSKLIHGNTYVLKRRNARAVTALYLLDPTRVTPLIADDGQVFYRLNEDNLSGIEESQIVVPASEIIHDRYNCLYHPLVGLPPTYASATPASMGITMQANSAGFFSNASNPGGVLTAPGAIGNETAERLKTQWDANYTGDNSGKVAVLGDGLKFEPMRMTNIDAQMMEHLRWTAEVACSVMHVPAYMVGAGPMPTHNNIEALTQQYFTQCLQSHIESLELALGEGLNIESDQRIQLDLSGLFRMDTATQIETLGKAVDKALMSPDEARAQLNLPSVPGGEYPYLQQQNYSLEALSKRDANDPFATPEPPAPTEEPEIEEMTRYLASVIKEELASEPA